MSRKISPGLVYEKLVRVGWSLAWRWSERTGLPVSDFASVMHEAIMRVAGTYDPRKGALVTFGWRVIDRAMLDHIRKVGILATEEQQKMMESLVDTSVGPVRVADFHSRMALLSHEAWIVAKLAIEGPVEVAGCSPKAVRGTIIRWLRRNGWSWGSIWRAFAEIREMVA